MSSTSRQHPKIKLYHYPLSPRLAVDVGVHRRNARKRVDVPPPNVIEGKSKVNPGTSYGISKSAVDDDVADVLPIGGPYPQFERYHRTGGLDQRCLLGKR